MSKLLVLFLLVAISGKAAMAESHTIKTLGLTIEVPFAVQEEPYKTNKSKVKLVQANKTAGDSFIIEVVKKPATTTAFLKGEALLDTPTDVKEELLENKAWRLTYTKGSGIYWFAEQRKVGKKWVHCYGYRFTTKELDGLRAACASLK